MLGKQQKIVITPKYLRVQNLLPLELSFHKQDQIILLLPWYFYIKFKRVHAVTVCYPSYWLKDVFIYSQFSSVPSDPLPFLLLL